MTTTKTAAIDINLYNPNQTVIAPTGTYWAIMFGFMRVGVARADSADEALSTFRALPGVHNYEGLTADRLPGNVAAITIEDKMHRDWLARATPSELAPNTMTTVAES